MDEKPDAPIEEPTTEPYPLYEEKRLVIHDCDIIGSEGRQEMALSSAERSRLYRERHPERWKENLRKYMRKIRNEKRGVTEEWYHKTLEEQGGGCAVCGAPPIGKRRLAIDHDHRSGKTRGLLCTRCNLAAGYLGDNPDRAKLFEEYLRKWQK